MTTQISGDTGVSQCQPNSVSQGDVQVGVLPVGGTVAPAAGQVGELRTNTGTLVLTSGSQQTVATLDLTAGVWDVGGQMTYASGGTHTLTRLSQSISSVNNAQGALIDADVYAALNYNPGGTGAIVKSVPLTRVVLASPASVYLVANTIFATAGLTGQGAIQARRAA